MTTRARLDSDPAGGSARPPRRPIALTGSDSDGIIASARSERIARRQHARENRAKTGPALIFCESGGLAKKFMADDSQILNSVAEEQAYQLSESAIRMDLARVKRADNPLILMDALNRNIEVWLKLRTIIMRKDCPLPVDTSKNLVKLSQFVVERTITGAEDMSESTLDALININLQIAEGLLEGLRA